MHPELGDAASTLGVDLLSLETAADWTASIVAAVRTAISDYLHEALQDRAVEGVGLYLVAFGSMARQEMGEESDFDYLVVAYDLGPNPRHIHIMRQAAEYGRSHLEMEKPGATGIFGGMVAAADLVNVIGLDRDTNTIHTRRILLLEESIPLTEPNKYRTLRRSLLNRYLFDYPDPSPSCVPRFLLNDVVRYWRSIAVDYQAKRWQEMKGEKWGLRYMKLRSTRKLTFGGTFVSLLIPYITQEPTTALFLERQLDMPPLARLAQLHRYVTGDARDALGEVLRLADRFVGRLASPEFRAEVAGVDNPDAKDNPAAFVEAIADTRRLQSELERLFYSTDPLDAPRDGLTMAALSRRYLSF